MIRFLLSFLIAIISCTGLNAKEKAPAVDENSLRLKAIESNLDAVSSRLQSVENSIELQNSIIQQEQTAIGNSLSASNRQLDVFAVVLAIVGIILGVYISKKEKSMQKLLASVVEKEKDIIRLKKDIEQTSEKISAINNQINNDIEGLYARLRREETLTYLNRLAEVPEDVYNLSGILLTRQLEKDDFGLLLKAYKKLMTESPEEAVMSRFITLSYKDSFLVLFFQNFCGEAINEPDLRKDLLNFLPKAMNCAFETDVKSSLTSLMDTLNSVDFKGQGEEYLVKYIIALKNSKHSDFTEPYEIIISKNNGIISLEKVWDNLVSRGVIIEPFGNLLCNAFKEDNQFVSKIQGRISSQKQEETPATGSGLASGQK